MKTIAAAAVAAAVCLSTSAAFAQEFERLAADAKEVSGGWALAGLLWSQLGDCDASDDLARRQCEGVRQARRSQVEGHTYLVRGGPAAVAVGAFDAKKKSAPVSIQPCVACAQPIQLQQQSLYVVGDRAVTVQGGVVGTKKAAETAVVFEDEAAYQTWREQALPRLRRELVVSLDGAQAWNKGGVSGVSVQVRGWRVYDPCTGKVIAAQPGSSDVPADSRACGDQPEEPSEDLGDAAQAPAEPAEPQLPYRVSPYQINQMMAPVRKESVKCFDAYGVAGRASFEITINQQGAIANLVQKGDFTGTPTGTCLERAIEAVAFPAMRKESMTFDYPIVLR